MHFRRGSRALRPFEKKRAIAPVVATMIMIVVVVVSVGTFAFYISGIQSQAEKANNNIQSVQNENLQITHVQLFPTNYTVIELTFVNVTVRNLNTLESGLVGIEINDNYTAYSPPLLVPAHGSIVLNINVTNYDILRTSPIQINLDTASLNTFSFLAEPPVANFQVINTSTENQNSFIFNASSSYSTNPLLVYSWNIVAVNQTTSPFYQQNGVSIQYYSTAPETIVSLLVVDSLGLVDSVTQVVTQSVSSSSPPPSTNSECSLSGPLSNESANILWNSCSQLDANYLVKYAYDPYVMMLHDDNEPGCHDYVGGNLCDATFWTTSDNVPTCWTLGGFGYTNTMMNCESVNIGFGAFTTSMDGMRYEPFAGYPIIYGNPGDHHTILLPTGTFPNQLVCEPVPPPCGGHPYGNFNEPSPYPFGFYDYNWGTHTYNIQSDAWAGGGCGTPRTGITVDVEAPEAINEWLINGNSPLFQRLVNDLVNRYVSSNYVGTGSTWQLGQVMFVMRVAGMDNTPAFQNMEAMLWSIQSANGFLPNQYLGVGLPGPGHDPENQDAGLLPFSWSLVQQIQLDAGSASNPATTVQVMTPTGPVSIYYYYNTIINTIIAPQCS